MAFTFGKTDSLVKSNHSSPGPLLSFKLWEKISCERARSCTPDMSQTSGDGGCAFCVAREPQLCPWYPNTPLDCVLGQLPSPLPSCWISVCPPAELTQRNKDPGPPGLRSLTASTTHTPGRAPPACVPSSAQPSSVLSPSYSHLWWPLRSTCNISDCTQVQRGSYQHSRGCAAGRGLTGNRSHHWVAVGTLSSCVTRKEFDLQKVKPLRKASKMTDFLDKKI